MTVASEMILTVETVPHYLQEHWTEIQQGLLASSFPSSSSSSWVNGVVSASAAAAAPAASSFEQIQVTTIQGGNVNYAFCIHLPSELGGKTVFLKQAPEFVAIFGPDGFPLTSDRMQLEMDYYQEAKKILGTEATKYLPNIYHFDKKQMVVIMEFLDGYEMLDHVLVAAVPNPDTYWQETVIAQALGNIVGTIHATTHSSQITPTQRDAYTQHYTNRALRDVQLEFVFTKAYQEATEAQRTGLTMSADFLAEIAVLKHQYNGDDPECGYVVSHGDFHPGSVMVDITTGATKLIDPEFTIYGPAGLDMGSLLHGYCLGAIHQAYSNNPGAATKNINCAEKVWESYKASLIAHGLTSEQILHQIEIETVGFTVAEVCRTALEFAGGRKWLQFDDPSLKSKAKIASLQFVSKCMVQRHTGGIALMFKQLKESIVFCHPTFQPHH